MSDITDKFYYGQRCGACGSTVRYKSSRECASCKAVKDKDRHEAKMSGKTYTRPKFKTPIHTLSVRLSDRTYKAMSQSADRNKRSMAAEIELMMENYYDLKG